MKSPAVTICPGDKIKLSKIDPDDTGGYSKEEALQQFCELREKIDTLQESCMPNIGEVCCSFFKRWTRAGKMAHQRSLRQPEPRRPPDQEL
jgi:hypothetical protein